MHYILRILAVLVLLCHSGIAFAASVEAAFTAKVIGVPTPKTLLLQDGRIVRLAAIQAPNLGETGEGDRLAREAQDWLQEHVENHEVDFTIIGNKDRHGRIVARAFLDGKEVQEELIRQGFAWIYSFPDSARWAVKWQAAERAAEAARRGVWGESQYRTLAPEEVTAEGMNGFHVIKGAVDEVEERKGRWFIRWQTAPDAPPFAVMIERGDARRFTPEWLLGLKGKNVRVRGWPFPSYGGAALRLTHPEQFEIF